MNKLRKQKLQKLRVQRTVKPIDIVAPFTALKSFIPEGTISQSIRKTIFEAMYYLSINVEDNIMDPDTKTTLLNLRNINEFFESAEIQHMLKMA